jgi:hypothetical protein
MAWQSRERRTKITYKDLPSADLIQREIYHVVEKLKTTKCGPCIKSYKTYLSQLKSQLRDKKREVI